MLSMFQFSYQMKKWVMQLTVGENFPFLPCYGRKYSTHRVRQITTKRWRMTEIVNHLSSILDKSSTKENICDENLAYIHDKVEDFTNQILQKKRRENAFR